MANPRYNTQTTNRRGAMGGGVAEAAKKVPFYAADGVGKMKKGGIAKLNPGLKAYMMKKKKKKGKK